MKNPQRQITVMRSLGGSVFCNLEVGDTKAEISVDRKGLHISGQSPSDPNHYYTCPLLSLENLKAMVTAIETFIREKN